MQEENIQRSVIDYSQRSAGQSGVQKAFLERYVVTIPTYDKQVEIAEKLDSIFSQIQNVLQKLNLLKKEIEVLPSSFLRKAFRREM